MNRAQCLFTFTVAFGLTALGPLHAGDSVPIDAAPDTADAAADATLFPVPDYTSALWERDALLGDWFGTRTALAERGIQLQLDLTQYYQGVMDGGRGDGGEYGGSADYIFKFDFAKLGLWPGAFLQANVETLYGDNINGRTGTLLPANSDALYPLPGDDLTAVTSVVFTQFLSEQFAVFGGKLDTTAGDMNEFAWGKGDARFMNLGLSLNPVPALTTPYSTLGAGLIYLPNADSYVTVSVYDPNGDPTQSGFDSFFEDGVSFAGETRLGTNLFGKRGHQLIGATYSNKDYVGFNQDPRLLVGSLIQTGSVASGVQREDDSWSVYYNFDQYLVGGDDGTGWGLFGRAGFADEDTNVAEQFYSLGLGGKGVLPGRENDTFGAGFYYLKYSSELPGLLARDDHEQGWELFYDVAVSSWWSVGADIQFLDSPLDNVDTAVVGGLRTKLRF